MLLGTQIADSLPCVLRHQGRRRSSCEAGLHPGGSRSNVEAKACVELLEALTRLMQREGGHMQKRIAGCVCAER